MEALLTNVLRDVDARVKSVDEAMRKARLYVLSEDLDGLSSVSVLYRLELGVEPEGGIGSPQEDHRQQRHQERIVQSAHSRHSLNQLLQGPFVVPLRAVERVLGAFVSVEAEHHLGRHREFEEWEQSGSHVARGLDDGCGARRVPTDVSVCDRCRRAKIEKVKEVSGMLDLTGAVDIETTTMVGGTAGKMSVDARIKLDWVLRK